MSLLLKSVWQNFLRGSPLSRSTLQSRSLTSTMTEVSRVKSPDAVMARLKAAPSADEVLAAVQAHLPALTHKHLLQALRTLFELQKAGKMEQESQNITKNPGFGVLCQHFKRHARALEVNDAVEAVKVLSYLQVPVDSLIVQTMLQLVRYNINLLNIRQIMFLDFILGRYDSKNHLVDALKLALPLAFQIRLPLELDTDEVPLLRDMLTYACISDLPERCVNNVVTALVLRDQALGARDAARVVWALADARCSLAAAPTRVQLLHICCDILVDTVDQLSYDEMLRTAAKMKSRVVQRHLEFYHEQVLDALAASAVRRRLPFDKGLLIARVLSRIAHTHLGLVEYLCQEAASNPSTLSEARPNLLFSFINCLSNNNYTPSEEQWTEIRKQISNNPVLDSSNAALPWTKLCLELASLGHYEDKVLNRVFSEHFLQEYLSRDDNTLDYLQLLTLHEAVKCFHSQTYELPTGVLEKAKSLYPLHSMAEELAEYLVQGIGRKEHVAKHVVLPSGIVADLLVCVKGGYPVKLTVPEGAERVPIEQLNLPKDAVTVCIMVFNQGCFSMNSNRLRGVFRLVLDVVEAGGCAAVGINYNEWTSAPARERAPMLLRELAFKCGEVGMKLTAV